MRRYTMCRYSITLWYFDQEEQGRARANNTSADLADAERDKARIEQEIAGFEQEYGTQVRGNHAALLV